MAREKNGVSNTILWISVRTFINFVFIFMLVEGFSTAYQFSYKLFADVPYQATSSKEIRFVIEQGESAMEISSALNEKGIVDGKYLFMARIYLGKYNNKIKAGEYVVSSGMTPEEICRIICGLQQGDNKS